MLVALSGRMTAEQRRRFPPEDLWQETLLLAFEHRAAFAWRGLMSFRRWLLTLADNRLRNLLEHEHALKRGGGAQPDSLDDSGWRTVHGDPAQPGPTPSRGVADHELAAAMATALDSLPPELQTVVRLRLFEGLELADVADRLSLSVSAVRHRFHRGIALYQQRLGKAAGSTWWRPDSAAVQPDPPVSP